eukprot:CAMPEP_0204827398 /NCGR_PEP_ID=MMETSP1346-20131115/4862_1 /ASSEMBLY_ACC=CAM_ASM_000771 /TAXON_ID=215587 /ORGANISM="Aplanochytrium stocchinoi, Strain GSBS06" /LENGTH=209 /DNA_ID=CAMNT_0051955807 /DNA_START=455 /DNA_END=1084 /DNA_ORIENTATION=+
MLPSKPLDWVRGHPFTATVAAVAAAAYSFTLYKPEQLIEDQELLKNKDLDKRLSVNLKKDKRKRLGISWGDEQGGSLTEILNLSEDEYEYPLGLGGSNILLKDMDIEAEGGNAMKRHLAKTESISEVSRFFAGNNTNNNGLDSFSLDESTSDENDSSSDSISEMIYKANIGRKQKNFKDLENETHSPSSPQWGWYVSFTPPQRQQFSRH